MKPPLPRKLRRRIPSIWLAPTRALVQEEKALLEFLRSQPDETASYWKCVRSASCQTNFTSTKERKAYERTLTRLIARLQYENVIARFQPTRSRRPRPNLLFIP